LNIGGWIKGDNGKIDIQEQRTSPGGGLYAGEFVSYIQGTGWTDVLRINFDNSSWGSVTINVQFPGNSSGSTSVFQQVSVRGYSAYNGGIVTYSDISGEGSSYFNWVSESNGNIKLQLKTQYATDDAAVRISYTMNHRTSQSCTIDNLT
jgi:hypothetical protein